MTDNIILQAKDLVKHFPIHGGIFYRKIASLKALNSVSFEVKQGKTLGIVGESGCGKSTLAKVLMRLHQADSGSILMEGKDLFKLTRTEMKNLQMIFQDPYSSLNPRMTIGEILIEPMDIHKIGTKESRKEKLSELLKLISMHEDILDRYPHEFSGGQRQRIGVARALTLNPKIVIADEPVSALDVSVQAQIINLMCDLQKRLGLSYVFISHDLSVVQYISDEVAVMYLGQIVEKAEKTELFNNPKHPYTIALLSAKPSLSYSTDKRIILKGDIPSSVILPSGCPFHTRCWKSLPECSKIVPKLEGSDKHIVACINT